MNLHDAADAVIKGYLMCFPVKAGEGVTGGPIDIEIRQLASVMLTEDAQPLQLDARLEEALRQIIHKDVDIANLRAYLEIQHTESRGYAQDVIVLTQRLDILENHPALQESKQWQRRAEASERSVVKERSLIQSEFFNRVTYKQQRQHYLELFSVAVRLLRTWVGYVNTQDVKSPLKDTQAFLDLAPSKDIS